MQEGFITVTDYVFVAGKVQSSKFMGTCGREQYNNKMRQTNNTASRAAVSGRNRRVKRLSSYWVVQE